MSTNAICPELYINTIKPYCLLHVNMFDINFIKCVYKTRFINTFRFLMIFVILNNNLNLFTKKSKIQDTNLGRYSIDFELMGVWITNLKKSSSVSDVHSAWRRCFNCYFREAVYTNKAMMIFVVCIVLQKWCPYTVKIIS